MTLAELTALFALNFLTLIWGINYKRILRFRSSLICSFFLLLIFLVGSFTQNNHIFYLFLFFFFFKFGLTFFELRNLLLPILIFLFEYILFITLWVFTYDIPMWLGSKQPTIFFLIPVQFIGLLFLIQLTTFFDQKYQIWASIQHLRKKYTFASLLLLFLYICLFVARTVADNEQQIENYLYLSIIMISLTCLVFLFVFHVNKNYKQSMYIQSFSDYVSTEKKQMVLASEFRHDYKTLLIGLNTCIQEKNYELAEKLMADIIQNSEIFLADNVYADILKIWNTAVQGILLQFVKRCKEKGIVLTIDIMQQPNEITMGLVDFLRCISVILNNALEASEQSAEKEIFLSLKGEGHQLEVIVQNSYAGTLSLKDVLNKHYSTKAGHSGQGLFILNKLTKSYVNVTYSVTKNDTFFTVELRLD